jgi:large subunit ribosomal protein L20
MPRVKRSVAARKKRRKVLGQAKGYWGLKKSSYRYAKEQVEHSLSYASRDRKN